VVPLRTNIFCVASRAFMFCGACVPSSLLACTPSATAECSVSSHPHQSSYLSIYLGHAERLIRICGCFIQSVKRFVHPSPVNAVKLLVVFQICFFERRNTCSLRVSKYLSVHSSFHHWRFFCEERVKLIIASFSAIDYSSISVCLSVCGRYSHLSTTRKEPTWYAFDICHQRSCPPYTES
ncbi:unnamed protein product, partial [Ectocarpus sp. 8 AP-2014]